MINENNNKTRTYLVIVVFILIIFLSGYIVYEKINERKDIDLNNKTVESILDNSNSIVELNVNNKIISKLYSNIKSNSVDEIVYLSSKEINWDSSSGIVVKQFIKDESSDYITVDSEDFEKKFFEIFGYSPSKLDTNVRTSTICGSASYDSENDVYTANLNCSDKDYVMKSYLKNVVIENSMIKINKYYVFYKVNSDNNELCSLYKFNTFKDSNLISKDIKIDNINEFMQYMPVISYYFKMDKDNNYYLAYIK